MVYKDQDNRIPDISRRSGKEFSMIHKVIALCKERDVTLTTYIHDQSEQGKFQIEKRPAIIIMPGGAYSFLSDTEGEPVALTFLKEGYNTFVLRYSV